MIWIGDGGAGGSFIRRLESGNFGAAKVLRDGCLIAAGFWAGVPRVFGREGKTIIILLGGGSKRRQDADIAAAVARWKRYQQAKKEKNMALTREDSRRSRPD